MCHRLSVLSFNTWFDGPTIDPDDAFFMHSLVQISGIKIDLFCDLWLYLWRILMALMVKKEHELTAQTGNKGRPKRVTDRTTKIVFKKSHIGWYTWAFGEQRQSYDFLADVLCLDKLKLISMSPGPLLQKTILNIVQEQGHEFTTKGASSSWVERDSFVWRWGNIFSRGTKCLSAPYIFPEARYIEVSLANPIPRSIIPTYDDKKKQHPSKKRLLSNNWHRQHVQANLLSYDNMYEIKH